MAAFHVALIIWILTEGIFARPTVTTTWSTSFCPANLYVNGINALFAKTDLESRRSGDGLLPIYGFSVSCTSGQINGRYVHLPILSAQSVGVLAVNFTMANSISVCDPMVDGDERLLSGLAVGLEKRLTVETSVKALLEVAIFCNYEEKVERNSEVTLNVGVRGHRWVPPQFCPWNEWVCGLNVKHGINDHSIQDVKVLCCTSKDALRLELNNYRGATDGSTILSLPMLTEAELDVALRNRKEVHYLKELDDPYYFAWEFCPANTYVTGMQAQLSSRELRFSCSDISKPKPRTSKFIHMEEAGGSNAGVWDLDDELSVHRYCHGVVIGFQVLYEETTKQIQGLRIFCSYGTDRPDKLSYVKAIFPEVNSTKTIYSWGAPSMCKRQEALCGFKTKTIKDGDGFVIGTEHIKAKCCRVPSIAEICAPFDDYELVVECDARDAHAQTTCQYTHTEGISRTLTDVRSYRREENMRNSLNREWSTSEAESIRHTEETSRSLIESASLGSSTIRGNVSGITDTNTDTDTSGTSSTDGVTDTQTKTTGRGRNISRSRSFGRDRTKTSSKSSTFSDVVGSASSLSSAHIRGVSQNLLSTRAQGLVSSDSVADTVGSSEGSVVTSGLTRSNSRSFGSSSTESESVSDTSSMSSSHGTSSSDTDSTSLSVGAEVGFSLFGVSASVKTNMESSFSSTRGTTSENSMSSSSTRGSETSSSVNRQSTEEQSSSQTNQQNKDKSQSKTQSKGTEKSIQDSLATGSESSQQDTDTRTQEENSQHSRGGGNEDSEGSTIRDNEESSLQDNVQEGDEHGNLVTSQNGRENSKSLQSARSREDSTSVTGGETQERSTSRTKQLSKGVSKEKSLTRVGSSGKVSDHTFSTGFDWSRTSGQTWTSEHSYQVHLTVPQGIRARLFQVVGYCAHFQIRTNNFRRVDQKAEWLQDAPEQQEERAQAIN